MSNVPKSKRKPSGFQVIDTSRELKRKVLQMCVKLPKRYTDLILKILRGAHKYQYTQ